jgi:hypothetical protein
MKTCTEEDGTIRQDASKIEDLVDVIFVLHCARWSNIGLTTGNRNGWQMPAVANWRQT